MKAPDPHRPRGRREAATGSKDSPRPRPREEPAERPAGTKGERKRGLRCVRIGLVMILLGVTLVVLTILAGALAGLFERPAVLPYLAFAPLAANGLSIGGRIFCLAVPRRSRAREIAWAAAGLEAASLLINVGVYYGAVPGFLENLGQLISLAALVLFVVFLMRLAVYLKLNEPAQEAEDLLGWGVWLVILYFVLQWLRFIPFFGSLLGLLLSFGMLIMMVVMFVRYVQLLYWLQEEIGYRT